jgi:peptide/nickel transport system substrate-binding protein
MDRKTPVSDKNLRQAMGYALNVDQVNKKFSNGLATRASSTIVPVFKQFQDPSVKGYPLDIKKANSILDKAGYKWDAKHEYRLDLSGKPFKLTYFARQSTSGTQVDQAISQNYIQQWKKIGVHVGLYHDRIQDFNTWAQVMTTGTAQDWDIMYGGWSVSSEPSQMDLYSKGAPYNFGHFTTPELTTLLNDIDSQKALDASYRKDAFFKYEKYMQDQAAVIPTSNTLDWFPVNKRVIGWTNSAAAYDMWSKIAVSADATK